MGHCRAGVEEQLSTQIWKMRVSAGPALAHSVPRLAFRQGHASLFTPGELTHSSSLFKSSMRVARVAATYVRNTSSFGGFACRRVRTQRRAKGQHTSQSPACICSEVCSPCLWVAVRTYAGSLRVSEPMGWRCCTDAHSCSDAALFRPTAGEMLSGLPQAVRAGPLRAARRHILPCYSCDARVPLSV